MYHTQQVVLIDYLNNSVLCH